MSDLLTISIERDEPLCGEAESDNTHEYEVECEMDGAQVHSSVIVSRFDSHTEPVPVARLPVELTESEERHAENAWSEIQVERWNEARSRHDDDRFERMRDGR